jgi:hypothetical protein
VSVIAGARRTGFRVQQGATPLMAVFGVVLMVLGAVASFLHLDAWGVPMCVFKATTGYPCMTCGATRALVRLSHLDLAGSIVMNPMVALAFLILVPWALTDALLYLRGQALVFDVGPRLGRVLPWLIVPIVLANWAYLIAVGR